MELLVETPADEPVVVITRMLDASRELVWEALTTPEHVAQWFGGPGFTSPKCEMDLRPGGRWSHVMRSPAGQEFPIESVFIDVEPPGLLSWKSAVENRGPRTPPEVRQTVTLEIVGDKTLWKLVARFHTLADRDLSVGMGFANMVSQGILRLAALLKTLKERS
jgi:uncharacterized protein YndB with AHSA1/START domain